MPPSLAPVIGRQFESYNTSNDYPISTDRKCRIIPEFLYCAWPGPLLVISCDYWNTDQLNGRLEAIINAAPLVDFTRHLYNALIATGNREKKRSFTEEVVTNPDSDHKSSRGIVRVSFSTMFRDLLMCSIELGLSHRHSEVECISLSAHLNNIL